MKQKELDKIKKAEKKRKEREELDEIVENETKNIKTSANIITNFIEEQDYDVEDDFEEDFEAWNAPSTRKHNSMPTNLAKSPFFSEILSFSSHTENNDVEENTKVKDEPEDNAFNLKLDSNEQVIDPLVSVLEIPTKSAQLERDLRSLKDSINSQREYLIRIDPENLQSIFKSSIEFETVLQIAEVFSSGTK